MKRINKKLSNLKIGALKFAVFLFVMFSGCAVPFETARNLEKGQKEGIVGWSGMCNLTVKGNFGVTGHTDLGFGFDLPFVTAYLTGKQKLLSFGENTSIGFFLSGAYGFVVDAEMPYYHCTLLFGSNSQKEECLTLGVGILQDPRYTFQIFGSPTYSRKTFYHALFGVSSNRIVTQVQFIYDPHDTQEKITIAAGLGVRGVRF